MKKDKQLNIVRQMRYILNQVEKGSIEIQDMNIDISTTVCTYCQYVVGHHISKVTLDLRAIPQENTCQC